MVLLLNKINIFLKQQLFEIIINNSLIFIFLRKLKYFWNIIFFTTNCIKTFDKAIINQVYFSLQFDNLNAQIKKNI